MLGQIEYQGVSRIEDVEIPGRGDLLLESGRKSVCIGFRPDGRGPVRLGLPKGDLDVLALAWLRYRLGNSFMALTLLSGIEDAITES